MCMFARVKPLEAMKFICGDKACIKLRRCAAWFRRSSRHRPEKTPFTLKKDFSTFADRLVCLIDSKCNILRYIWVKLAKIVNFFSFFPSDWNQIPSDNLRYQILESFPKFEVWMDLGTWIHQALGMDEDEIGFSCGRQRRLFLGGSEKSPWLLRLSSGFYHIAIYYTLIILSIHPYPFDHRFHDRNNI